MPAAAQLGGIGVFHWMNDRTMRSRGLSGNHCLYVLELDRRLDIASLNARLDRAVRAVPELCFRLDVGLGRPPRWRIDPRRPAPQVTLHEATPLPAAVDSLLAERLDGDRPWAVDVVRDGARDALVFRWYQPLVDGKGAERLLRWLGSGRDDELADPPPEAERYDASTRPLAGLDRDARITLTRAYNSYVCGLGRAPIASLASPASPASPALGASRRGSTVTRALRVHLSEDETRTFDQRVRKVAKLAETSVMVLAAARVVDRALLARGLSPAHLVVPLPISLDPKGEARRLLGNNLSMLMLSLDRDDLRDDARAIAHLGQQQRAIVQRKLDVGMLAALDFASYLPRAAYQWLAERPFRGEMASLICSNPGAISISSFAGAAVLGAYPVPAVLMPPGFQVIYTRFAGRLSAVIVYVESAVSPEEAATLAEALKAELLGQA